MDDELREGRVERPVLERQPLGGRLVHVDAGNRVRMAATNGWDGSTAATDAAPSRATSSAVSAPGPQPTSSDALAGPTPARSASCGESSRE